jgi:flavodoxin
MPRTIPFIPDDAPFTEDQRAWLNGFLAGIFSSAPAPAATAPIVSLKIAVLYASQSGTAEGLVRKLTKELKAKGYAASLTSLEAYTPAALAAERYAVFLASTYGEGEAPDAVQPFYEQLCVEHFPGYADLSYSVIALGDRHYENFCKFGMLGIAGASFGVALSLGSGWFPKQYKGLAMGIAGAGNSGTALAALLAPRLALHYGWQQVYGFAASTMVLPLAVMIFFAKEPPDIEHQTLREQLSCLFEKDGWVFNLIYVITFGGFLGLATFLPSFFYSQFHVSKIQAGSLTVLATLTGSLTRVMGGWFADRVGGITTLSVVFLVAIAGLIGLMSTPSLAVTTFLFMLCFAALGAGNGATF